MTDLKFEDCLARLEQIVAALEAGNLPLEDSLKVFAEAVLDTACALELIHAYSLIHDDLPAMDDDDYRRGRLTNHKVFGEAMAILAGDALLTLAFRLVADNAARLADPRAVARVVADV